MRDGLRILVVGGDANHDLSAVTNRHWGWTPQVLHMTQSDWELRAVTGYVHYLSCVNMSAVPAERHLLEEGHYPIAEDSTYFFHLHGIYTQLGDSANHDKDADVLTACQITQRYLHDPDKSPLVDVVLTEAAWVWDRTEEVWLDQFPTETMIWVARPGGGLEIVRAPKSTVKTA